MITWALAFAAVKTGNSDLMVFCMLTGILDCLMVVGVAAAMAEIFGVKQ